MRRRSKAGGEPTKAQRRKTATRKSRIAPKAARPHGSSAAHEATKVARLIRERDDALWRQTTTAIENTRLLNEFHSDTALPSSVFDWFGRRVSTTLLVKREKGGHVGSETHRYRRHQEIPQTRQRNDDRKGKPAGQKNCPSHPDGSLQRHRRLGYPAR